MGHAYLMWVHTAGISGLPAAEHEGRVPLAEAISRGALKLTLTPRWAAGPGRPLHATDHDFDHHLDALNVCDEVRDDESALFLWSQGRLVRLEGADTEGMVEAVRLLEGEIRRRNVGVS